MRKLFKGGNYSRAETICGNTVRIIFVTDWAQKSSLAKFVLKCSFFKQSLALHEITLKVNLVIIKSCKACFAIKIHADFMGTTDTRIGEWAQLDLQSIQHRD